MTKYQRASSSFSKFPFRAGMKGSLDFNPRDIWNRSLLRDKINFSSHPLCLPTNRPKRLPHKPTSKARLMSNPSKKWPGRNNFLRPSARLRVLKSHHWSKDIMNYMLNSKRCSDLVENKLNSRLRITSKLKNCSVLQKLTPAKSINVIKMTLTYI